MSRFDAIAEQIGLEIDPQAIPQKRLTAEEEALVGLLSKILVLPCQKRYYHEKANTTCLEDMQIEKSTSILASYFVGEQKPCAVCMIKMDLAKITGEKP